MKCTVVLLLGLAASLLAQDPPTAAARLPLLRFADSTGEVQLVTSVAEWERRRAAILEGMQQVMGPLPGADKRTPLEVHVDDELDCGDHIRRLVGYQSEPGNRVPAYLLIPKSALPPSAKPVPAILCLHPTNHELGNKTVVGLGPNPTRAYALELTRRGFVTLAPAYPHLANYAPDLQSLGYVSGTMKAIWDNIRALDLLESLPFVRGDRFGVIGHSLGGHNAIFTAVFDARICVVVSSCGFDSFGTTSPVIQRCGRLAWDGRSTATCLA